MSTYKRRHQHRYMIKNPNRIMMMYKKIFVFYYRYGPFWVPEKFPNHNLKQIGCQYQGWFHVGGDSIGEIWRYPTERHKILVQMSIDPRSVLWQKEYARQIKRRKRLRDQENAYMTKMIKKMLGRHHVP